MVSEFALGHVIGRRRVSRLQPLTLLSSDATTSLCLSLSLSLILEILKLFIVCCYAVRYTSSFISLIVALTSSCFTYTSSYTDSSCCYGAQYFNTFCVCCNCSRSCSFLPAVISFSSSPVPRGLLNVRLSVARPAVISNWMMHRYTQ